MKYTLQNEQLTVQFTDQGAELTSVKDNKTGQEFIWPAKPEVWARHAPILFPIVGKLNNNRFYFDGEAYSLPQHGFARDMEFVCTHQTKNTIEFELTDNKITLKKYPFKFVLTVHYQLTGRLLEVFYEVRNTNPQPLPFSIGAHPGFYCSQQINGQKQAYKLEFELPETLKRYLIADGLQSGKTSPLMDKQDTLLLTADLFKEDALVLKNLESQWIRIVNSVTGKNLVTVHYFDFPYMGIWQKPGADFYCIEPWFGIADEVGFDGDIMDKEGIQVLPPKKTFHADYTLEFH